MKKQFLQIFACMLCVVCMVPSLHAQSKKIVLKQVQEYKKANGMFKQAAPILVSQNAENFRIASAGFTKKATFAKLDKQALQTLFLEKSPAVSLSIPYHDGRILTMDLIQADIFADGFKVSSNINSNENYTSGVYYRGVLADDENSLVAISIFEDGLMGIISTSEDGNINIGRYAGTGALQEDYILFAEKDVLVPHEASCATPDVANTADYEENIEEGDSRTTNVPQVYIEGDYQLYQNKGSSVSATSDYLTGIFNNSATIYTNDGITMEISEIFVWTSADGYSSSSSYSALDDFIDYRTTFDGDVAHLVALDANNGGVAATINGLCTTTEKYCYSDVDASYSEYPTYSWTVMVFTHELGHIFGSYHTHWCGWVGGAIDDCAPDAGYPTEGGCSPGPTPTDGGTIMSYCHLISGVGINFNNGFGSQPADRIIDAIEDASCLGGGGGSSYCLSEGTDATSEWIDFVRLGGITRSSGSDNYYDGTSLYNANLKIGTTKKLKVSAGMSGGPYTENWKAWIDWNHDYDFDDAGEEVLSTTSSSTGTISTTFTVPSGATLGATRLRIAMKNGGTPGSCETFSLGEVEDYKVTIKAALPSGELVVAEDDEMLLYPNPATNSFYINCSSMESETVLIEIIDLTGKVVSVQSYATSDAEISVPLKSVSAGMYLVKTTAEDGSSRIQSLVVE